MLTSESRWKRKDVKYNFISHIVEAKVFTKTFYMKHCLQVKHCYILLVIYMYNTFIDHYVLFLHVEKSVSLSLSLFFWFYITTVFF